MFPARLKIKQNKPVCSPTLLGHLRVQGNNRDQASSSRPTRQARDLLLSCPLLTSAQTLISLSPNLEIFLATKKDYQSLAPGGRGRAGSKAKEASRRSRTETRGGQDGNGGDEAQAGPATRVVTLQMAPLWPWLSPA